MYMNRDFASSSTLGQKQIEGETSWKLCHRAAKGPLCSRPRVRLHVNSVDVTSGRWIFADHHSELAIELWMSSIGRMTTRQLEMAQEQPRGSMTCPNSASSTPHRLHDIVYPFLYPASYRIIYQYLTPLSIAPRLTSKYARLVAR